MAAPISIIIPTLDASKDLPSCLAALMEGLDVGLIKELVISDGGSKDATLKIADAAGAVMLSGAPSRGGQLRRGVMAAKGDWFLVLHADTQLDAGWSRIVSDHLRNHAGKAGFFQLRFDARGLMPAWVAGWANLRARIFGMPFGDQGLLVPRALYDAAGGFPDQPLMEDVALARALRGRLVALGGYATTNAQRYKRGGWLRRGARNLGIQLRYLLGVSPEKLAARYRR